MFRLQTDVLIAELSWIHFVRRT